MAYGLSNSHVTDDVTWPPKVLWGSTVGYPSDSLASCQSSLSQNTDVLHIKSTVMNCNIMYLKIMTILSVQVNRRSNFNSENFCTAIRDNDFLQHLESFIARKWIFCIIEKWRILFF